MNRRADRALGLRPLAVVGLAAAIMAVIVSVLAVGGPAVAAATSTPVTTSVPDSTPSDDVGSRPPSTDNDFLPEDRDLSSCVGALERPGCGSESRGGWRQTVVLVVIFAGLAIVFGNVIRGVRRNRPSEP